MFNDCERRNMCYDFVVFEIGRRRFSRTNIVRAHKSLLKVVPFYFVLLFEICRWLRLLNNCRSQTFSRSLSNSLETLQNHKFYKLKFPNAFIQLSKKTRRAWRASRAWVTFKSQYPKQDNIWSLLSKTK